MKYVVIVFWAIILGQVVNYLSSTFAKVPPTLSLNAFIIPLIIAFFVILITKIGIFESNNKEASEN
ncbi:MAG: YjzD family protein [Lactobacillales bacterium]|jgi:uncharacterized membrane protein YkvI|nr:YjzD family protein [Lactobacillales bacterium]